MNETGVPITFSFRLHMINKMQDFNLNLYLRVLLFNSETILSYYSKLDTSRGHTQQQKNIQNRF